MKIFFLTAVAGIIFSSGIVVAQQGRYRIEGTIDNSFDGQKAKLISIGNSGGVILSDTSRIDGGRFFFEGEEYLENQSTIYIENEFGTRNDRGVGIFLEQGTISISYLENTPHIGGTPLNDILMSYRNAVMSSNSEIKEIEIRLGYNTINGKFVPPGSELERLYYELGEYMIDFIKENYHNPVGREFLKELLVAMSNPAVLSLPNYIYVTRNERSIDEIYDFIDAETRESTYFISYKERLKRMTGRSPLIGRKLDAFILSAAEGGTARLSDYIGKKDYTYLKFWASWCSPCIADIPEMKELFSEYSDRLEIVSISLDTDKETWLNSVEAHDMPWPQFADLEGFDSDIAKKFEIKSIPFGLLIDRNGFIIDVHGSFSLGLFMEQNPE